MRNWWVLVYVGYISHAIAVRTNCLMSALTFDGETSSVGYSSLQETNYQILPIFWQPKFHDHVHKKRRLSMSLEK